MPGSRFAAASCKVSAFGPCKRLRRRSACWRIPDESLEVRQAVLPLGVPIDHFGHFRVGDFKTFALRLATGEATGERPLTARNTGDFFAPAEFFELSQDERMTRRSYENFNAGLEAEGLDNLLSGGFREMSVSHERKLIDDEAPPERKTVPLPPFHFVAQIRSNAVAKSQHGRASGSDRAQRLQLAKRAVQHCPKRQTGRLQPSPARAPQRSGGADCLE